MDSIKLGLRIGLEMAQGEFILKTGQTPKQFAQGMIDKAYSMTVKPVMTIYGPNGMLDKAAQKTVDHIQGELKPDDYYSNEEESKEQLQAIIDVGGALFPGFGEATIGISGSLSMNSKLGTAGLSEATIVVPATISKASTAAVYMTVASGGGGSSSTKVSRTKEVLELFTEAQSGLKTGATPKEGKIECTHKLSKGPNPRTGRSKPSSALRQQLIEAGDFPPGRGHHAHHIVPRGMHGAERAREILRRAGIGLDSALNGIWLPGNAQTINVEGRTIHAGIHSGEYLGEITRILAGAETSGGEKAVQAAMERLKLGIQEVQVRH